MIFRRDRKRKGGAEEPEEALEDTKAEATDDDDAGPVEEDDLVALDALDWRGDGPWDVSEVDDLEDTDSAQRIDLGSLIITGVPGSELRLQVAEETKEIVSAMLVIETKVPAPARQARLDADGLLGAGAGGVRSTAQRGAVGGAPGGDL